MTPVYDHLFKGLSDSELLKKLSNTKIYSTQARLSAWKVLKRRGIDLDSFQKPKLYPVKQPYSLEKTRSIFEEQLNGQIVTFWMRMNAYLVDIIVLIPLSYLLQFFFYQFIYIEDDSFETTKYKMDLLFFIFMLFYHAIWESSKYQATPGKIMLKMKVVDKEGNRISFSKAMIRFFARFLSALILGFGFIYIFMDDKKRSMHDIMSKIYVIKKYDRSDPSFIV